MFQKCQSIKVKVALNFRATMKLLKKYLFISFIEKKEHA